MHTSFLYQAFGLREQECSRVRYEDNSIIFDIQTRSDKLRCPCCQSRHIIHSEFHFRRIRSIPIGSKQYLLNIKIQRIECKDCACIRQEDVYFLTGKRTYTNRLAHLVVELSLMCRY